MLEASRSCASWQNRTSSESSPNRSLHDPQKARRARESCRGTDGRASMSTRSVPSVARRRHAACRGDSSTEIPIQTASRTRPHERFHNTRSRVVAVVQTTQGEMKHRAPAGTRAVVADPATRVLVATLYGPPPGGFPAFAARRPSERGAQSPSPLERSGTTSCDNSSSSNSSNQQEWEAGRNRKPIVVLCSSFGISTERGHCKYNTTFTLTN
jgi:hypothetical protein